MILEENLYRQICRVMPIPCVDLIVEDARGRVLLLKRKNEPTRGQWWFPGGRVDFGETRFQAVGRKLKEECGLVAVKVQELGTYDLFFDQEPKHAITTIFQVAIQNPENLKLDGQSEQSDWRVPSDWEKVELNTFIKTIIRSFLYKKD